MKKLYCYLILFLLLSINAKFYPMKFFKKVEKDVGKLYTVKKIFTREDDIKNLENEIENCKGTLLYYAIIAGNQNIDSIFESCKKEYTFSSIFFNKSIFLNKKEATKVSKDNKDQHIEVAKLNNHTVDNLKACLDKFYKTKCDKKSSKEHLLTVFKNIIRKRIFILRAEKGPKEFMDNNYVEVTMVKKLHPKWIKRHEEKSSQSTLLMAVNNLSKKLDDDYKALKKKEKLYNQFKQLAIIENAFKKIYGPIEKQKKVV